VRILAAVLALAACHGDPPAPCRCTPSNAARTKRVGEDHPIDGAGLLALVRRHRTLVEARAPNRDVKLVDDEIRIAVVAFCQPCGDWVGDRMTVDEMFPLARLDDATAAVCLGLVLRDGSTAFGPGHPAACGP
jgi:hypothetical protein